jgi:hypothetical protein
MATERGPYTRRFGLSGQKSTVLVIESLTNDNNAVDGTFYDAIKVKGFQYHMRQMGSNSSGSG